MNIAKRIVRTAIKSGVFLVLMWASTDEEKEHVAERLNKKRPSRAQMERDAAYLTTGLITAARAINTAHDEGEDCGPHHDALMSLLSGIDNQMVALRAIQHLVEIVAHKVGEEDVQNMVASLVALELDDDSDDILNSFFEDEDDD